MNRTYLQRRWAALIDAMLEPSFELDSEEFAGILTTLAAIERAGIVIDPGLRAIVLVLARQMVNTDADSDQDISVDDGLEHDSCAYLGYR